MWRLTAPAQTSGSGVALLGGGGTMTAATNASDGCNCGLDWRGVIDGWLFRFIIIRHQYTQFGTTRKEKKVYDTRRNRDVLERPKQSEMEDLLLL
jgi:hypothetical protein